MLVKVMDLHDGLMVKKICGNGGGDHIFDENRWWGDGYARKKGGGGCIFFLKFFIGRILERSITN